MAANLAQNDVYMRMRAFLEALFDRTAEYVKNQTDYYDLSELALRFRNQMTEGQTFNSTNRFRKNFYRGVIELAEANYWRDKVPHALFSLDLANANERRIRKRRVIIQSMTHPAKRTISMPLAQHEHAKS